VDIFPTLCDLSGLKIPENLDGKSLLPLMKNPEVLVNEFAISQYPHGGKMGYSIRTSQYRLIWWMNNGFRSNNPFSKDLIIAKELYDYEKDPLETVNVLDDKEYVRIVADLENKMSAFFESQRSAIR
jgi:arylsulfatase A-like enzyme